MGYRRTVPASVGVVNGGLGINLDYHGLEGEAHTRLLFSLLTSAGFRSPRTVRFERNKPGMEGEKIDWNRLRISNDECQQGGIIPLEAKTTEQVDEALLSAVRRLEGWMRGNVPWDEFSIVFDLGSPVSPYV